MELEGWKEGRKEARREREENESGGWIGWIGWRREDGERSHKKIWKKEWNSVLVCVCAESGIKESCFSVGPLTALHTILRANKQRVAK